MDNWEKWLLSPSLYSWQIVALTYKLNPNEIQNSYDYPSWSLFVPNAIQEDFEDRLYILDQNSYISYFVTSNKPPQVRTLECYRWVIENTKWIDLEDSFYLPLKEYLLKKEGILEEQNTINQGDKLIKDIEKPQFTNDDDIGKSKKTFLKIIGILLQYNQNAYSFDTQTELIEKILQDFPNVYGLSKKSLDTYFGQANSSYAEMHKSK